MNQQVCAVILAGGEGKRMKSDRPKALNEVLFQPMIRWVISALLGAGIDDICVVTGSKREYLEAYLQEISDEVKTETVFQSERLGTGHAVMTAGEFIRRHSGGSVLILNGDAPFIGSDTIRNALESHLAAGAQCTVISAEVDNPKGYGRIVRRDDQLLDRIVEEKEATPEIRKLHEVNSGAYWFGCDALIDALSGIIRHETTGEYYLTDTVEVIKSSGGTAAAFKADNADSVLGANDCIQLADLNEIARRRILKRHMENGVNIPCSDGVMIGTEAVIGAGTLILPASIIIGKTTIGTGCMIGPASYLRDAVIPDNQKA